MAGKSDSSSAFEERPLMRLPWVLLSSTTGDNTNYRGSLCTLPIAPNRFRMPLSIGEDSGSPDQGSEQAQAGMNQSSWESASCNRESSTVHNDLRQTV